MTHPESRRAAVEAAIAQINDPAGQGAAAFTRLYFDEARLTADTTDQMARMGVELPPLAGIVISVKDLFDIKGEVTLAGSKVLATQAPAPRDAEVVRRLRNAGGAIIGKTNMTEFAFSGLGLNPHYGTPLNVWDRGGGRIPGGSSSGAAISITDGMAEIAIGTDTAGSCRIPAALNGLVGFKPSAHSVPKTGAFPLSYSYDSVGPIAATTSLCAQAYAVLSNTNYQARAYDASQLVLAVVTNYVLENLDPVVATAYEAALAKLARAGAVLREVEVDVLNELGALTVNGGISGAQAYQIHRRRLESDADKYDQRVAARIHLGANITCSEYIELHQKRSTLIDRFNVAIEGYHAVVMPTVSMVAPEISSLSDGDAYVKTNLQMLRNTAIANMMDACSISLPCHQAHQAPVGLMLTGASGSDWRLLTVARAVEQVLKPQD